MKVLAKLMKRNYKMVGIRSLIQQKQTLAFCSSSHDDFKPKIKRPEINDDNAFKIIQEVI